MKNTQRCGREDTPDLAPGKLGNLQERGVGLLPEELEGVRWAAG